MKDVKELILENEGLIYKAAHQFEGYDIDDLYQAGCIGFINGLKNFDEKRGTKLSSYIYPYILGEMKKTVNESKPLKVSRDINRLRKNILKAEDILSQKLMRKPSTTELCDFLQISEFELREALYCNIVVQSIESNIANTDLLMEEILTDPYTDYDDLLYLKMIIESLEEPERTIMIKRYYEDLTQKEVAKQIGLNQVDISRREGKVLSKIKVN